MLHPGETGGRTARENTHLSLRPGPGGKRRLHPKVEGRGLRLGLGLGLGLRLRLRLGLGLGLWLRQGPRQGQGLRLGSRGLPYRLLHMERVSPALLMKCRLTSGQHPPIVLLLNLL